MRGVARVTGRVARPGSDAHARPQRADAVALPQRLVHVSWGAAFGGGPEGEESRRRAPSQPTIKLVVVHETRVSSITRRAFKWPAKAVARDSAASCASLPSEL